MFVCVHNAGKSQTAAALMRHIGGEDVDVYSAGTAPGEQLAADAVAMLSEIGISTGDEHPKTIDPQLFESVDRVIVLGTEAKVAPTPTMKGNVEVWPIVEPAEQGIMGDERARLIRDDIIDRILELAEQLGLAE
jgi:arsenate-mycothiol transferase